MKNSKILTALAGLSLILSIACGQKKDDKPAAVAAVGVTGGTAVDVPAGPPRMPQIAYVEQEASVVGTAQAPITTSGRAFSLADPNLTTEDVGTITAIKIKGLIALDQATGAIIPGAETDRASSVQITVIDSFVGTTGNNGEIQPIMRFFRARAGGHAANGLASLVFVDVDGNGTVTVNGTYNVVNGGAAQSTFQGTIGYQNTNGTSGVLGTFSISTCSFFRCQ